MKRLWWLLFLLSACSRPEHLDCCCKTLPADPCMHAAIGLVDDRIELNIGPENAKCMAITVENIDRPIKMVLAPQKAKP